MHKGAFAFVAKRISQSKLEHVFGRIRGHAGVNNLTEAMYAKGLLAFSFMFDAKHMNVPAEDSDGPENDDMSALFAALYSAELRGL